MGTNRARSRVTFGRFAFKRIATVCLRGTDRRMVEDAMFTFLLWLLLLVVCWPLALLALVLWPLVWLFTLPFRLAGIAVGGVFEFLSALVYLPARILRGRPV